MLDKFSLIHKKEGVSGKGVYNKKHRIVTYFEGDKRFKLIHTEHETESDCKSFFYDFSDESPFHGDIYSFISLAFHVISQNGGVVYFNGKELVPINKESFSGVGQDELNDVIFSCGKNQYTIKELIEDEF